MADEKERPGGPEEDVAAPPDLSVPMWVWTVLGFALVLGVVIIVIIWGGGKRDEPAGAEEVIEVIEEEPETQPSETQPAELLDSQTGPDAGTTP